MGVHCAVTRRCFFIFVASATMQLHCQSWPEHNLGNVLETSFIRWDGSAAWVGSGRAGCLAGLPGLAVLNGLAGLVGLAGPALLGWADWRV